MKCNKAAHIQEDADGVPPADSVAIALQVLCESLRVALRTRRRKEGMNDYICSSHLGLIRAGRVLHVAPSSFSCCVW